MKRYDTWSICGRMAIGVALASTLGCASTQRARSFTATGPTAIASGASEIRARGVVAQVFEARGTLRMSILRELTGARVDPFDVEREGFPIFRVFVIEIENGSRQRLYFNPSFCAVHLRNGLRRYPLGYTELYPFLKQTMGDDAVVRRFAPVLAETGGNIEAGESVTKLLVFNRIGGEPSLSVELGGLRLGDVSLDASLGFERSQIE